MTRPPAVTAAEDETDDYSGEDEFGSESWYSEPYPDCGHIAWTDGCRTCDSQRTARPVPAVTAVPAEED